MKLPTKVDIAGHSIPIIRVKMVDDTYAQYEHEKRTIFVDINIKDDRTFITSLRHEVLEASLLLSGVGWSEKYDQEPIVRCVDEIFWPAWESLKL